MKVFVVCHRDAEHDSQALIRRMSRIHSEPSRITPVIVVENCYNLDELPDTGVPTDYHSFNLEDFYIGMSRCEMEPNRIAVRVEEVDSHWVLFNAGQHGLEAFRDFVKALSRYNFTSSTLRDRNLVFTAPLVQLCAFACVVNESFNNLPVDSARPGYANQVRTLFFRIRLEVLLGSLPLPIGALRRVKGVLRRVYRRMAS